MVIQIDRVLYRKEGSREVSKESYSAEHVLNCMTQINSNGIEIVTI